MKQNTITSPSVSLPKGGGAIRSIGETFEPNVFTGTGTLTIPFPLSPARDEMQPAVALTYNSGSGNGPFGIGFTVPLNAVSRQTDAGIPRYEGNDIFILTGAGELVPDPAGHRMVDTWRVTIYRPRLETEFALIEYWQNTADGLSYWKVTTGDNETIIYGQSELARVADPGDPTCVFSWLLEEARDNKGNCIQYSYRAENDINVPPAIFEQHRSWTANRYIDTIRYGNYFTGEGTDKKENFAFEIVFDYGGYDLNAPDAPPGEWTARQDPFSTYRAGFEIRTFRLCRAILQFHRLDGLYNGERFLVKAMKLGYDETPAMSFLTSVQMEGFRRQDTGEYLRQQLPPMEFRYSQFRPGEQEFTQLEVHGGTTIPGYLERGGYQAVDLYGEGLTGFLYSGDTTTLYFRPEGDGHYSRATVPDQFPTERDLESAEYFLSDLDGDGHPDLIVNAPPRGGYYKGRFDGSWETYRSFESYPFDFASPRKDMVDLNGDGLADIAIFTGGRLRYYLAEGTKGFHNPVTVPVSRQLPVSGEDSSRTLVEFADMFGDGLQHRVLIRSGSVECWPNLGYGRFGEKVLFGNAPTWGDTVATAQIFLADLDGSGTADIVIVHPDRVDVFFNRSGNSFSDPLSIRLPTTFSKIDRIEFADVYGTGTSCMIVTAVEPEIRHYCYDFIGAHGSRGGEGNAKPYLLQEVENNIGATTRIAYTTSTVQYLRDLREGRQWPTRLPFPVHVVEKVESIDRISRSKSVTRYRYHDGYFDPVERQFRGFGFVEQWDTETYEEFARSGLHGLLAFDAGSPELHSAPKYTKAWYYTGAFAESGVLTRQYEKEYYRGSADIPSLADSALDPAIADAETLRQAYAALSGSLLHTEVYGLDDTPEQNIPYTIAENNYAVRLLQPAGTRRHAVFFVHPLEAIAVDYQRIAGDPRIQYSAVLDVDEYGNTRRTCQVYYPRCTPATTIVPADPADRVQPEQTALRATVELGDFKNITTPFRLLGVPCTSRDYEIGGLVLPGRGYFTLGEVRALVETALGNAIAFGEPFTPGEVQARLYAAERYYYWNEQQTAALPLCQVSPRNLLHHIEEAIGTTAYLNDVYGNRVTASMFEEAGYVFADNYWWNPGSTEAFYSEPEDFYQLRELTDTFGSQTTVEYDDYRLDIASITQLVADTGSETVVNVTTAITDYHTMQPAQITDINGTIQQVLYDPLGMVIVSSISGTFEGQPSGDMNLADYILREHPTFEDVIDRPEYYIEGATSYFYYDAFAWKEKGTPSCSISVVRRIHVSDDDGTTLEPMIAIVYSDGFGRDVEKRQKSGSCPDSETVCWVVSGRTVYNNKSLPVEQYLPYFAESPLYSGGSDAPLELMPPPTRTKYDPLDRIVRIDTPKGFFSRVVYTAWVERHYDEDDTVKESQYYLDHIHDTNPDFKDELDALKKAAVFADTPTENVLDNMGRQFLTVAINVWEKEDDGTGQAGGVEGPVYLPTRQALDIAGNTVSATDPRLGALVPPVANDIYRYDMTGRRLYSHSVDAGELYVLPNIHDNTVQQWNSRGLHFSTQYDLLQRPLQTYVEGGDQRNGLELGQIVERWVYGESAPEGAGSNLRGEVYRVYDQAGILTNDEYDIQGRIVRSVRRLRKEYKTEADWSDPAAVEMEDEEFITLLAFDVQGHRISETTPDTSVYSAAYGLMGELVRAQVQFTAEEQPQVFISSVQYNAAGLPVQVDYGNGVSTQQTFEPTTLRLAKLYSFHPAQAGGVKVVQNTVYTYDPVGNPTRTRDYTHQTVFCNQQQVEALSGYRYNAIYQLLVATGREHPGILPNTHITGFKQSLFLPLCPQPHPNDMTKLQVYKELYTYDNSGNLTDIRHYAPPGAYSWTREITIPEQSNRAVPQDSPQTTYDAAGNMLALENIQRMRWDYSNSLVQADVLLRGDDQMPDSDYYVYDASGLRVRKVSERMAFGGDITDIDEVVYIGNYILRRSKKMSASAVVTTDERQSLRVMNGEDCIAIADYTAQQSSRRGAASGTRTFRYQLNDSLGSSVVELNERAEVISYEEYFPYGGTSVIAGNSEIEVEPKVYRYSGRECDDTTGLYYYGARYYISWLGRWLNPDPAGPVDGLNLYEFVSNNPLAYIDNGGFQKYPKRDRKAVQKPYDQYLNGSYTAPKRNYTGNGASRGGLPRTKAVRRVLKTSTRIMDRKAFESARKKNIYLVGLYFRRWEKVYSEDLTGRIQGRGDEALVLRHFKALYKDSLKIQEKHRTAGAEVTGEFATARHMLGQNGYSLRLSYFKGTGIDQVWQKGSEYLIVEAKGEGATLSRTDHGMQMSTEWVQDRLIKLYNSQEQAKSDLAKEIFKAADLKVDTVKRTLTSKGKKPSPATIRGLVVEANWTQTGLLSGTSSKPPDNGRYFN